MRRKLSTLILLLAVLTVVAWAPPAAECFACDAEAKRQCGRDAMNAEADCYLLYGALGYPTMCSNVYWETYEACLMVKGCPIPPKTVNP